MKSTGGKLLVFQSGNEICSVNTSVEASLSIQQQPHVAVRGRRPYLPGDPASLGFYGPAKAPLQVFVSFHAAQDIGGFEGLVHIMKKGKRA